MKLRLQGQLEALEWVMQQIEDIRDSTEITNEPEHEGMPHEHGLVPPQEGDTVMVNGKLYVRRGFAWEEVQFSGVLTADMMQQPGESRADWKNRTFAMQYGSGRLSQRDPSQQSLPPHSLGPILLTPKVARSMKEEAERQWAREQARMDETNFGPRNAADTIHDTLRDWWASPQYQAGKSPVTKIKITDITES
jgi:hypothetical protein